MSKHGADLAIGSPRPGRAIGVHPGENLVAMVENVGVDPDPDDQADARCGFPTRFAQVATS